MKTRSIIATAVACGLGIPLFGPATAAFANDVTLCASTACSGSWAVKGTWDDSIDTLCGKSTGVAAAVKIEPVDGTGPTASVGVAGDRKCTGNLSVPEDELYRMTIYGPTIGTKTVQFYT